MVRHGRRAERHSAHGRARGILRPLRAERRRQDDHAADPDWASEADGRDRPSARPGRRARTAPRQVPHRHRARGRVDPSYLTAYEYLYFVGQVRKVEGLEGRIARWFEFFDLDEARSSLCKDLSKGTRQKLMLAARSEERRVGKECRSRGGSEQ